MAQSGYTPILIYASGTTGNAPSASNLNSSSSGAELAINYFDGKLFYKDASGNVQILATKSSAAGIFPNVTITGGTINGTTIGATIASTGSFTTLSATSLTLTNALTTANGGTGNSSFTAGDLMYYASGTAMTKLGIGTSGQILTSTGSAPQWSSLSGVAVTSITFGTTGLTPSTPTGGSVTVAGTLITSNGGTGLSSWTAGQIPYYSSGTTLSQLNIGTSGQILTSTGTAPQWSTLSSVAVTTFSGGTTGLTPSSATSGAITLAGTLVTSNGGTGISSFSAGDLMYYSSGTALSKLGIGTSGQILTSTGSAPQWSTASSILVTAITAGTGIGVSGSTGNVTVNATGTTINSQTSAYTLVAGDAGKTISITTGGVTVPASVMSAGNIITIFNNSGSSQTITQGTGLTLQWAGQSSSTTGNRTLGLYGVATILYISATSAIITGAGLT